MRYIIPIVLFIATSIPASAQIPSGYIAQWKFNGNAGDSSGNGFHGTASNVTYTAGKLGAANTAAKFNGTNSSVAVAYQSQLNVDSFSICTVVRVDGFNTSKCQGSYIFDRGFEFSAGHYQLLFGDGIYDNGDCNKSDTTKHVFYTGVDKNIGTVPLYHWDYTPRIVSNKWYCVVSTYSNDTNKLYVDGVLMTVVPMNSPLRTSTEGVAIGANLFNINNYPYWLKGTIDDISLYNRPLSVTEVSNYCMSAPDTITTSDSTPIDTSTTVGMVSGKLSNLALYPNPNNGNFHVTAENVQAETAYISIVNSVGQFVYKGNEQLVDNKLNVEISTSNLAAGLYMLNVETNGTITNRRFVVLE